MMQFLLVFILIFSFSASKAEICTKCNYSDNSHNLDDRENLLFNKHQLLEGMIGKNRICMNITLKDYNNISSAHYYYATKLIDIPLMIDKNNEDIILKEPSGGVFNLHFETNDKTAKLPLNFYTSTALSGVWKYKELIYPVYLGFSSSDDVQDNNKRYEEVLNGPVKTLSFEKMVQDFIYSALKGDKSSIAKFISYPLKVNTTKTFLIKNKKQFFLNWSKIMNRCVVKQLQKVIPHEMFVHEGLVMVANGDVWFDAKGIKVINPDCN